MSQQISSQILNSMPPRQTNPEWLLAKPLLEQDYRTGRATDAMSPDEVIQLRPQIYGKVPRTNFLTNWRALKLRIKENPDGPQVGSTGKISSWDIAKVLLEKDYLAGKATDTMTVDQVIALRPLIYGKVPRSNFMTNWKALKIRVTGHIERAKRDDERYEHDMETYMLAKDLPWEWHGSDAEHLLKEDVALGRDLRYAPSLLYLKRKEYQDFDYGVFRKHIHQEARSALETPYWMVRKEKKKKKEKATQEAVRKALEEAKAHEAAKVDELALDFNRLSF